MKQLLLLSAIAMFLLSNCKNQSQPYKSKDTTLKEVKYSRYQLDSIEIRANYERIQHRRIMDSTLSLINIPLAFPCYRRECRLFA